jgi:hypothetical protein
MFSGEGHLSAKDAKRSEEGLPNGNFHRDPNCVLPTIEDIRLTTPRLSAKSYPKSLLSFASFASFAEKMPLPKNAVRSVSGVPIHA